MKIFSLYDSAASAYMTPFFLPTAGLAERQLREAAAKEGTALHTNPQDFKLYELGTFDPGSGVMTLHQSPVPGVVVSQLLS